VKTENEEEKEKTEKEDKKRRKKKKEKERKSDLPGYAGARPSCFWGPFLHLSVLFLVVSTFHNVIEYFS
jgi:hypothetical protein